MLNVSINKSDSSVARSTVWTTSSFDVYSRSRMPQPDWSREQYARTTITLVLRDLHWLPVQLHLFLLLFWHAPLEVHSTKHRHQSSEWTILNRVNCFIHADVNGFQVLLYSFHSHSMWTYLLVVSSSEAVMIFLASLLSGIWAVWPNR